MEYNEKPLIIALEISDRAGERRANGNLDHACKSLCGIEYNKKDENFNRSEIGLQKEEPMEVLVMLTTHWVFGVPRGSLLGPLLFPYFH